MFPLTRTIKHCIKKTCCYGDDRSSVVYRHEQIVRELQIPCKHNIVPLGFVAY
jgi:hypothetical protein